MIRTVPNIGSEEIELYIRTYFSLLRSTDAIKIGALIETHTNTDSSLHIHARDPQQVDVSALVYASLRLPLWMHKVNLIVLGQLPEDFARAGFGDVESWDRVHAPGRRRRAHFDNESTLAVMIASRSDIDDLIPILTAFQIEWNKINRIFRMNPHLKEYFVEDASRVFSAKKFAELADAFAITPDDVERLQSALKDRFFLYMRAMSEHKLDLALQLLASSQVNYRKAVSRWWENLDDTCQTVGTYVRERPVYFVSSNTHALANIVSGYAQAMAPDLQAYMSRLTQNILMGEWESLQHEDPKKQANFLYYIMKKYQSANPQSMDEMIQMEESVGFYRVEARHGFDVEGQVLNLNQLNPNQIDPRLTEDLDLSILADSDALVVNIDYPLGLAAFELLTRVGEGADQVLGIYVMGKAATLNGQIGDIMLPNVVHDEHSKNTYLFDNCFRSTNLTPYLMYGMLLDNQKALTARGTFLQNRSFMDVFYKEGYTILEMEAGPYLSAVYEMIRPVRHPYNEIVNLYSAPFDVGFIHYASDTPYSKGHNLGAGSLGYQGMDATYASAVAIMRRILSQEINRLTQ